MTNNDLSGILYWNRFEHEEWTLTLAATSSGLSFVGFVDPSLPGSDGPVFGRLRATGLVRDDKTLEPYATQFIEYFQGKRKLFTFPLDLQGTPFQRNVWEALQTIPYGQTRSYSEIAAQIQNPAAIRAVGAATGANPLLIVVPCHRVIGKDGAQTGYRDGVDIKQKLLQWERNSTL